MLTEEFFAFMREREQIRLRRSIGLPREQWTQDPIFQQYKFTNVKREHDRTTRELLEGFYKGRESAGPAQRLVNCAMARFIGRAETVIELGWIGVWDDRSDIELLEKIEARMGRGEKIFTGAYIIPNCGRSDDKHVVVVDIIREVAFWAYRLPNWFSETTTFRGLVEALCTHVTGMGSFMAKEVLLDFILTSGWTPPDWNTWTPVGPGARRGAARVLSADGRLDRPLSEPRALEVAKDLFDAYRQTTTHWVADPVWPDFWYPPDVSQSTATESQIPMVKLCLADIQFQLCEFDKYLRVKIDGGRAKTTFRPRLD